MRDQRRWSRHVFGPPRGLEGIFEHIREELDEILMEPTDSCEWADLFILAMDAAWRAGLDGEELTRAIRAKQDENQLRQWPDWRKADHTKPINHVRDTEEATDGAG
jgi:hypothetical protein